MLIASPLCNYVIACVAALDAGRARRGARKKDAAPRAGHAAAAADFDAA
jgi:hypothetical protein